MIHFSVSPSRLGGTIALECAADNIAGVVRNPIFEAFRMES
jgi:hypothetical protein